MKKGGELRTCITPLESSHRTKSMVSGSFLADLMANLGTVRGDFGMNVQDAAVLMSSEALKYIITAKERKRDD